MKNAADLEAWLADLIESNLSRVDIPLLARLMDAFKSGCEADLTRWTDLLLALRETHELRLEEKSRGRAMVSLLEGLAVPMQIFEQQIVGTSQLAGFAMAATHFRIPTDQAVTGYVWSWLENQVLAGIKIIPLGQSDGHRILLHLDAMILKRWPWASGYRTMKSGPPAPRWPLPAAAMKRNTQDSTGLERGAYDSNSPPISPSCRHWRSGRIRQNRLASTAVSGHAGAL